MSTVQGTKARRGQLFVFETMHSAAYLKGGRQESLCYHIGKSISVSREGEIKRYVMDDAGRPNTGRPARLWLIPPDQVDAEALWQAWLARPFPRDFPSLDEARAFALQFKRKT